MTKKDDEMLVTFHINKSLHRSFKLACATKGSTMTYELVSFIRQMIGPKTKLRKKTK